MRALPQHTRMHYSNYSFTPLAGLLCVLELLGPRRHVCVKCVSPLGLRAGLRAQRVRSGRTPVRDNELPLRVQRVTGKNSTTACSRICCGLVCLWVG